jgi:hypothetical protein
MSPKVYFSILVAVIVLVVGFLLFNHEGSRVTEDQLVENLDYRLRFTYPGGPDGYELIESSTSDSFLQSYVMVEGSELAAFQDNGGDLAPPTMSVFMFQFPDTEDVSEGEERPGRITRLQNWAQENSGLTAFGQMYGTPDIVEIDGVRALEYTTDGPYQQTVYLVAYRGTIYMFLGQYDRPTDHIKQDFENLLETVRFE